MQIYCESICKYTIHLYVFFNYPVILQKFSNYKCYRITQCIIRL